MSESFESSPKVGALIRRIRGQMVMLSEDLARLYEVAPRVLLQAVKRNVRRFPADFMFQLDRQEVANLKSQIVISSWGGARRSTPYAFTEQGVAMLASVLRSERAIEVNIAIVRAFVRLRETMAEHRELAAKLAELEDRVSGHDRRIGALFEAIRQLMAPPDPPRKQIGFHARHEPCRIVKEGRARYGSRRVSRS